MGGWNVLRLTEDIRHCPSQEAGKKIQAGTKGNESKNYLNKRQQMIRIMKGSLSKWVKVTSGVPQGPGNTAVPDPCR